MTALTLWRLNLCDGVHIGYATKVILYRTTLGVLLSAKEMEVLLQILTTGPVTTATNERSFIALRYLKTYLRLTAKEARIDWRCCLFTVTSTLILNMWLMNFHVKIVGEISIKLNFGCTVVCRGGRGERGDGFGHPR